MTTIWLGTAGWSYFPDWDGPFYPAGTTPSDALARYCEAFRFVEIDSTFYAAPAPSTVERWADVMPPGFRTAVKVPRELVQDTALRPPDVPFGHFAHTLLAPLGDRVGAIVVQMPPSFQRTPANDLALRVFCQRWGRELPIAVELRHRSWRVPSVAELFAEHGVTWVSQDLQDVPDLPRAAHDTNLAFAYVRLLGHHDGIAKTHIQRPQDEGRAWWVDRIARYAERGVGHVYVVANNHYEGHAPQTLRSLADALAARALDVVRSPGWPDGQVSLF